MRYTPIIDGFKEPIINPEDYHFGSGKLLGEELQPDGQWVAPASEHQADNFETYNCTAFATTSCLEILFKKIYNQDINFSDRFVGIISETGLGGNSPHKVVEKIRHEGLIPEGELPFAEHLKNINEYYSYKGTTQKSKETHGLQFLNDYTIKHDWVLTKSSPDYKPSRQRTMVEALKFSPLGVSVHAWRQEDGLYTNKQGIPDNHWTACIGYKAGEYWIIFDSYAPYIKHLNWDYPFQFVKRYNVIEIQKQRNWLIDLLRSWSIIKGLK